MEPEKNVETKESLCCSCVYGMAIKGKAIRRITTYEETRTPVALDEEGDNRWQRELDRSLNLDPEDPASREPQIEIESVESYDEDLISMSLNTCFFPYEDGVVPQGCTPNSTSLSNCFIEECSRYKKRQDLSTNESMEV